LNIPVIPLPHVVFFPHTVLPLELFEPRHRALVEDALLNGSPIAIPHLDPKSDDDPVLPTPVRPIAGLGRIKKVRDCTDGRILIELKSEGRVRLIEELRSEAAYRQMLVEPIEEPMCSATETERALFRSLLLKLRQSPIDAAAVLLDVMQEGNDASRLADLGAHLLIESSPERQSLFEELDPKTRFSRLIDRLCGDLSKKCDMKNVH
jgi:uncharacterized protein